MSSAAEKKDQELEMHPIATRILYEDVQVRIWDQVIEPGQELKAHHHENDYVLVDVEGSGELDVEMLPGNEGKFDGEFKFEVGRPGVHIIEKGGVERAFNPTDTRYRTILVELLD